MFAVDLSSIRVCALEGLSNDGIEWFQEHGEVVEGCDGVCYDVFEPFEWVFGLGSLAHEVWVHAA